MEVIVTSLEAWDTVWRRNQHLVAGLMRRDPSLRVLFVEPSSDPLHAALGGAAPRRGAGLRPGPVIAGVQPGRLWLLEPTKWLPRRVDRRFDERWARKVLSAARALDFREPVVWVNDPTGALLLAATAWPSLYDVTDDWTLAPRSSAQTERIVAQEDLLLSRCEEVVVCSPALAASKGSARAVTLVPNGVDTAAYLVGHPRPSDLPVGPVALYAGTLHSDRLDLELCVELARGLAGAARLVLLGPNALQDIETARLDAAGAVLLGRRPSEAVPAYLQHADLLVVPHVVTPFTDSLDPIKLYEYAAAGRPVVATPVAGFRDTDDPLVIVANEDRFVAAVRAGLGGTAKPLSDDTKAGRVDQLDWSHRVAQMADVLGRLGRESERR